MSIGAGISTRWSGTILDDRAAVGRADDTIVIFTSDHGTQAGAHGYDPWEKRLPFEESIHVPWIMCRPGTITPGSRRDVLPSPVNILPSLCGMCGIGVPRTV